MSLLKTLFRSQRGIAVDEAVLVATMVTGFGAFAAVSLSWSGFGSGGSSSEQVVSQLKQIEAANYEFYARHRMWPHQATDGQWTSNVSALISRDAMRYPYRAMTSFKNLLPDMKIDNRYRSVRHEYGNGGNILQRAVVLEDGSRHLEIIYENVPYDDARNIDVEIDGEYSPESGKVYVEFGTSENVNVHYVANEIES